uniref:G_PROTEIN_RECEP_F1_2 domain-containing protein n=1 Tax=Meloidogyne hapla TaxID=6305 RepID=A0A1I8BHW1_MELHA
MDFIPYKQAILIQIPSLFGFFGAVFMLVTLSIDRLLAVIIPITYRNLKQFYYISIQVFIVLLHIIYGMFIMNIAKIVTPNWMISGGLGDLFTAPLNLMNIIYYSDVCIMLISIICYLIVGILIKFKTDIKDERIKKMYLSLFLIVFVNIGGYFICNVFIAFLLFSIVKLTPIQVWFWNNIFAIFLNIAAASIGPILYFNSGEYRIAFKRAFTDIKKILKLNKSTVSTIKIDKNQKEKKITPVSK